MYKITTSYTIYFASLHGTLEYFWHYIFQDNGLISTHFRPFEVNALKQFLEIRARCGEDERVALELLQNNPAVVT
jgi:hypothetical protein